MDTRIEVNFAVEPIGDIGEQSKFTEDEVDARMGVVSEQVFRR